MKTGHFLNKLLEGLERLGTEPRQRETLLPEVRNTETRQALGEAVAALLEHWELHESNQAALLGLERMTELKQGQALPEDAEVLERVGHLLAIGRALLKRFPYEAERQAHWVTLPEARLDNQTPLAYMLGGDLSAIKQVRAMLESDVDALQLP